MLDYALQRDRREVARTGAAQDYGEQLTELLAWLGRGFPADHPFAGHYPLMPGVPAGPDVWVLGSSPGSPVAAGQLGVPYAFAGFINPAQARPALETYRRNFTPADTPGAPEAPRAMLGINAVCADTDQEAAHHAMTVYGLYHRLSRRAAVRPAPPHAARGHRRDRAHPAPDRGPRPAGTCAASPATRTGSPS